MQLVGLACSLRCTLPLTVLYLKVMAGTRLPQRQGVVPLAAAACHSMRGSVGAYQPFEILFSLWAEKSYVFSVPSNVHIMLIFLSSKSGRL